MATSKELAEAYQHCGRITKAAATSFYYAFKTLPSVKRNAIYATYAFCRISDDIADEEMPLIEKKRLLHELRASLFSEPKEPINGTFINKGIFLPQCLGKKPIVI